MSTTPGRLRAIRGATSVPADEPAAISAATAELLQEMIGRNGVDPGAVVSLLFTATPDLTSSFPAAAARSVGLGEIPLLCAQELAVAGSLPRCIRVLMHVYSERDYASLRHVYLREARGLRDDLQD